jgi:DNA-binding MarR family transcriptional regulator
MRRSVSQRFWSKVQKTNGCWLWTGSLASRGYGQIKIATRISRRSHRLAWELTNGPIPRGLFVCHRCDNRRCVNPDHLFLGTNQDNMDDMKQKGRSPRYGGAKSHKAKLTESDVQAIRADYSTGSVTMRSLADRFGVTVTNVSDILKGHTWRDTFKPIPIRDFNAKLSLATAAEVRSRYNEGDLSQTALANLFGVSQSAISRAIRRAARR